MSSMNLVCLFVRHAMPWLLAIVLILVVRDTAYAIAGADSAPSLWSGLMGNIRVSRGFAFVFGALGLIYGLLERNRRISETERLRARVAELKQYRQEQDSQGGRGRV